MDDYLNNLFNDGNEPEEPAAPEVNSEPAEQTPDFSQAPQQETPPAGNYYQSPSSGEYRYVPPVNKGTYFTPPQQNNNVNPYSYSAPAPQQPQQNEYYTPSGQPNMNPLPPTPPVKKRKSIGTLAVIAVICAVIAIGGLIIAGKTAGNVSSGKNESSVTQSEEDTEKAQAEVKSSDKADKTDKNGDLTPAGVAAENKESCVGITVYTEVDDYTYFYNYGSSQQSDGKKVASGEGSGVIMSEANGKTYIITCAHVIADGSSFKVTLDNDKEYDATMVGYDSQTDIGVLSIAASGLKIAEFGDSKDIEVGESCVAIGCPGGIAFKNSVTSGIVSALDVPISSSIGYSNECIQVDAAINPGNSGGALFNMQGQVIGINSSKIASTEYEGMGFAVPSNTAIETANSLIKNGYVAGRAKIGIKYNAVTSYNNASSILSALTEKGFEDAQGTMVIREIDDDSDIKGKVQEYDMIVAVDGKTLTSVDIMTSTLSKKKPGETVKLTIARIENNRINTFEVSCKLVESKN